MDDSKKLERRIAKTASQIGIRIRRVDQPRDVRSVLVHERVSRRDSLESRATERYADVSDVATAAGRPSNQRLRFQLYERARVRKRKREQAEGARGWTVRLSGEFQPSERPPRRESNGHVSGGEELRMDRREIGKSEGDRTERVAHVDARVFPRSQLPAANRLHDASGWLEVTRQTVSRIAGRRILLGLRRRTVRNGQTVSTVAKVPTLR